MVQPQNSKCTSVVGSLSLNSYRHPLAFLSSGNNHWPQTCPAKVASPAQELQFSSSCHSMSFHSFHLLTFRGRHTFSEADGLRPRSEFANAATQTAFGPKHSRATATRWPQLAQRGPAPEHVKKESWMFDYPMDHG